MTRPARTRRAQHTLYLLRREYGGQVTFYRLLNSTSDPTTGNRTTIAEVYPVRLAVVLPAKWSLQERRGISLISANKQMVQGGQYEAGLQNFIVDSRDIPFQPTSDDWLVHDHRRFDIAGVDEYEDESSWLIYARALPGRAANQIFPLKVESLVSLTQEVTDAG